MSALTTVKLVLFATLLLMGFAALILALLHAATRQDEPPFPQTDEAGQ